MTDPRPESAFRGNPPNREQLAAMLGDRLGWWNALRETAQDIGATWKWAHSEATGQWSYRSYLEGDRFFAALTPVLPGFEVSLNLKVSEWQALVPADDAERSALEALAPPQTAEDADPAWVHVAVADEATLRLVVKMLVARAARKQAPRRKPGKKR